MTMKFIFVLIALFTLSHQAFGDTRYFVGDGVKRGAVTATVGNTSGTIAITSGNVATATALASNPTDCSSPGTYATSIDAQGNLTCSVAGDFFSNGSVAMSGAIQATEVTNVHFGDDLYFTTKSGGSGYSGDMYFQSGTTSGTRGGFYANFNVFSATAAGGIAFFSPSYYFDGLTQGRAAQIDASGNLKSSSITLAELGYLAGVSSAIQSQLNTLSSSSHAALTLGTTSGLSLSGQVLSLQASTDSLTGAMTAADHADLTLDTAARHSAVTLGTENGLSLSGQALSLAAATDSVPGAMTSADHTALTADTAASHAAVTIGTANGLSLSGQAISMQAASVSQAGTITAVNYQQFDDDPSYVIQKVWEFFGYTQASDTTTPDGWYGTASGAPASISTAGGVTPLDNSHPGVLRVRMGTSTSGNAWATTPMGLTYGGGVITMEWLVQLSALSNGTDTYTVAIGFGHDFTAGTLLTDGTYFRYSNGNSSGNWEFVSSNNGTRTTLDTGVAAVAGSWVKLKSISNAAGTSIQPYINGVAAGSPITSNIPAATARNFGPYIAAIKSAGTTDTSLYADYCKVRFVPTTPR